MRFLSASLALMLCACASELSASTTNAPPVWRMDTTHLEADRGLVRACLDRERATGRAEACRGIVQANCLGSLENPMDVIPAMSRRCDWRAIAAWEDEMAGILATLRQRLGEGGSADLDLSQRAWEASMLADVGLNMNYYPGGSLAGPLGAHVRAEAVTGRVLFLVEFLSLTED